MFAITFFTHWKLGEKSIVDAHKCAKLAVESFERPVERDRSNGMTISEAKYMFGNPTISHKKTLSRVVLVTTMASSYIAWEADNKNFYILARGLSTQRTSAYRPFYCSPILVIRGNTPNSGATSNLLINESP